MLAIDRHEFRNPAFIVRARMPQMRFHHFWGYLLDRRIPVSRGSLQEIGELRNTPNRGSNSHFPGPVDCKSSPFFPRLAHDGLHSPSPPLPLALSSVGAGDCHLVFLNRSPKLVFHCDTIK